ncbi:hypothetical protein PIB30_007979 [Stylosanthes scabra]|uniref:DUF220 domain-containing protein n=1 Tax=Stylosanthes scabra TaxID=79078 RepID=A0ABU6T652_9FABA|nr:hypothetical protein [Stylosanthes scabra]
MNHFFFHFSFFISKFQAKICDCLIGIYPVLMMADSEVKKFSINVKKNGKGGFPKALDPAISTFFVQIPNKLQNVLKSQLSRLAKRDGMNFGRSVQNNRYRSFSVSEAELNEQLQLWRENPSWVDRPPEIKVTVPKGSLCNLDVEVDVGLPPDAVYNIVTDPDNRRVFKNIKEVISREVLVDEGHRQVMKFKQIKTGFMKKFEGCWRVEPLLVDEETCFPFKPLTKEEYKSCTKGKGRIGSKVTLQQILQPAIVPPPPISWYLRGITSRTTEMLIHDLLAEAARIRGNEAEKSKEKPVKSLDLVADTNDIKERWILHRKNAKQNNRRLLAAK